MGSLMKGDMHLDGQVLEGSELGSTSDFIVRVCDPVESEMVSMAYSILMRLRHI